MGFVSRVAASRPRWPRWMSDLFDRIVGLVPESIALRVNPAKYGFTAADVPPPPTAPATPIRLYLAPVNFAAQGYRWARAAELLPGVGAVSMQYRGDRDYGFPSDNVVPARVYRNSRRWQEAQFAAVAKGFTHVGYQAQRPMFGELFDLSVVKEVSALRQRGLTVGMFSLGSDLRLPSRHREIDKWSPFHEKDWDDVAVLEKQALRARQILAELDAPVFVATPDQLLDWPAAHWLPIVVRGDEWWCDDVPLTRDRPLVIHAPSKSVIKGSDLIESTMTRLHDESVIEYRRVQNVPAAEMPALYRSADVVLDQFRIGNYATAAIESMAAGRVVVGHVHDQVREVVNADYGVSVPVVQATPDTLDAVIRSIVSEREVYRQVADAGPEFAALLHDGRASAEVLRPFLCEPPPTSAQSAALNR